MAGQKSINVSSEVNQFHENNASSWETSETDIKLEMENKSADSLELESLVNHAFAIVQVAQKRGVEPSELLAKILESGQLLISNNAVSPLLHKGKQVADPVDLMFPEEQFEELVF
jgi:hypothetical protein